MKKNFFKSLNIFFTAAAVLLFSGCVSEQPSDITLDELEQKMAQAIDPTGEYKKASTYFQRQNIKEEGFFSDKHQLVEVKFQRPDKFKFSYYEKNKVATEIISVGGRAWAVDYNNAKLIEIQGEALEKFKVMLALGHPDTDYAELFAQVDMTLTTLEDDRQYYKLVCHPKLPGSNPIVIYVDKITSLPKRMELAVKTVNGTVESVSDIVEYRPFGKINVASLTNVTEGSREYTTRVVDYQLNAHFSDKEFDLPTFDLVLWESYKQQNRRR